MCPYLTLAGVRGCNLKAGMLFRACDRDMNNSGRIAAQIFCLPVCTTSRVAACFFFAQSTEQSGRVRHGGGVLRYGTRVDRTTSALKHVFAEKTIHPFVKPLTSWPSESLYFISVGAAEEPSSGAVSSPTFAGTVPPYLIAHGRDGAQQASSVRCYRGE